MAIYQNLRADSAIRSVEIPSADEGGFSFFHLDKAENVGAVKQWLASADAQQQVVGETQMDGHPLLITQSARTPGQLFEALQRRGDQMAEPQVKRKFNPWFWRGATSIVGQSLQLLSSFKTIPQEDGKLILDGSKKKSSSDKAAIFGFAAANLLANITNMTFGSQEKGDPHQLRLLKENFNKKISGMLSAGKTLPSPEEDRMALRPAAQRTAGQKAYDLGQKYSVSGGEIGLRIFGATSLAFPVTKWWEGAKKLADGESKEAFKTIKNSNDITYKVGLGTLAGKFISLASKEPDPFNPKPPSALDKFREKVTFPLSSVVEGVAAGVMMVDRFKNQKIKLSKNSTKIYRDHFGGWGNLVFIGGYVIRLFAPYGSLEVNMKELNAHISDGLARLPREKLQPALAEVSAELAQHFRHTKKKPSVAQIYSELADDLKQFHQIDVASPDAAPDTEKASPQKSFASPALKKSAAAEPAQSHRDRLNNVDPVMAASII